MYYHYYYVLGVVSAIVAHRQSFLGSAQEQLEEEVGLEKREMMVILLCR